MYIIGITLDVSIFIVMAVLYFSIRSGKIPKYIGITAGAILLYVLTDICWMYLYYKNLYIPNSLIDVLYLASLLGIAAGAKLKAVSNIESPSLQESESSNVGFKHKGFLLLIYPVLVLIFKGLVFTDLLVFVFIILVHKWLSAYIQVAIKNEQLLKREKDLNVDLESRISERMKDIVEKNEKLDFLSNHDMLTILYNRRYFIRGLEEMILQVAPNETLALLFLDIDRFKTINDTYGHHVGDQILIVISQRLQNLELQNSLLARLGGDEFVLAFHSNYGYQKTEEIAQQIIRYCKEVIIIERYSFHITVSMGISIYPFDAQDCETLMKNADIAMYQAKKQGYNKYVSFNEQLNNVIRRKNEIEILLKDTDLDKEFELFYQPQFSIPEKKLIGMEALLRWNKPGKGVILPGEFISIAEETDDIIPIGNWVMKKAIGQIANWNNSYGLKLKMGINVSPKQMDQTVFISKLKSAMEDFLIKPEWLDVEITEGVAIEGEYKIAEIAKQFKNIGVSISIDDFGTGYSSLSRLKNIPFDRIKIAKPLIDAITTNSYDMEIIKHTISLAKSIGIKTIAEGVELQDQFDLLVDLGCEEIQGYILGKPMPALEFEKTFIETRNYYQTNTKFTKKAAHSL
jgi:diguanylate cyclase (GGDEF)-like protein